MAESLPKVAKILKILMLPRFSKEMSYLKHILISI